MIRVRAMSAVLAAGLTAAAFVPVATGLAAPASAAVEHRLHVGSTGGQVVWVQHLLGIPADGYYGLQTRASVVSFQRYFHLQVTGEVGWQTARQMQVVQWMQGVEAKKAKPKPKPKPKSAPRPASDLGQRAISLAASQAGKHYVWGASGPNTFDCSGLTQYVFSRLGKRIPRTTYTQYAAYAVPQSSLRPGDLVFSSDLGHVGIYAGYGSMWDAPHTGANVRLERVWYSSTYKVARVR